MSDDDFEQITKPINNEMPDPAEIENENDCKAAHHVGLEVAEFWTTLRTEGVSKRAATRLTRRWMNGDL